MSHISQLVLRVVLGFVFLMHGWQKIVTNGLGATEDMFSAMDVPAPGLSAAVAGWAELIGGILLIVGLFTRIIGVILAIDMAGAFLFVHQSAGFWNTDGGYEFVLVLGIATLVLAGLGAGRYSIDYLIEQRRKPEEVKVS